MSFVPSAALQKWVTVLNIFDELSPHSNPSPDRSGDFTSKRHCLFKLRVVHRLIPVAHGIFWIGMHFEDQAVGAGGNAGGSHLRHKVGMPGSVAGVHNYR